MTIETINTIGLFTSPVIAVVVTLVWQRIRERRDRINSRKEQLFLSMMAHRRMQPPSQTWVDSLNLIDVVFADSPEVLRLWHEYYDLLGSASYKEEGSKRTHKHLELLSAMAQAVGFRELRQTDIDKFYVPTAHGNESELNWQLRVEMLRVLKGAQNVVVPSQQAPIAAPTDSLPTQRPPEAPPNSGTPASEGGE